MDKSAFKSVYAVAPNVLTALGSGETFWQALYRGESGLSPVSAVFPEWFPDDNRHVGALSLEKSPSRLEQILERTLSLIDPTLFDNVDLVFAATSLGDLIGPYAGQPHKLIEEKIAERAPALRGKIQIVSSACSSGSDALSLGFLALQSGQAQTALILAVDSLCPAKLAHHIALGTQSPTRARPFDLRRDGTSFGEGGASLILAATEGLSRLSLTPRAEVLGVGFSCDGHDITVPDPTGKWAAAAIRYALTKPQGSLYINAHGTGTPLNDQAEAKALLSTLDLSRCYLSSTKGAFGHCLGATGLMEAIIAIETLATGKIPCTAGLEHTDPTLKISPLPQGPAQHAIVEHALSVTFGFGGVNSALFFGRADP